MHFIILVQGSSTSAVKLTSSESFHLSKIEEQSPMMKLLMLSSSLHFLTRSFISFDLIGSTKFRWRTTEINEHIYFNNEFETIVDEDQKAH